MENAGGFAALSRKIDLSGTAISNYLKGGRYPKIDVALKLAEACNISPNWLILGNDESVQQSPPSLQDVSDANSNLIELPYYDVRASAEFSCVNDTENSKLFPISRALFDDALKINPKNCFIINIAGDSMEPTLRSGDKIIVDRSEGPLRDGMYSYG